MKKYFTLCLFAFAMLFATQNTFAQEAFNANESAIKKTEELKKIMDLTQDQQKQIIDLLTYNEGLKHELNEQKVKDGVVALKRFKVIEDNTNFKLKKILTEKQYTIYQESIENREIKRL